MSVIVVWSTCFLVPFLPHGPHVLTISPSFEFWISELLMWKCFSVQGAPSYPMVLPFEEMVLCSTSDPAGSRLCPPNGLITGSDWSPSSPRCCCSGGGSSGWLVERLVWAEAEHLQGKSRKRKTSIIWPDEQVKTVWKAEDSQQELLWKTSFKMICVE